MSRTCLSLASLLTAFLLQTPTLAGEAFRKTQPKPKALDQFNQAALQQFTLKNGLEVFLVERHQLPIVTMNIFFPTGQASDTPDHPGKSSVCMEMLTRGTQSYSRLEWNEALADLASSITTSTSEQHQAISIKTLSGKFPETMKLLEQMLTKPGTNSQEFDRLIQSRLASLKQAKGSAKSIAYRLGPKITFGDQHPLGRIATEDHLKRLKVGHCRDFVQKSMKPKGAQLFVVGDLTKQQIEDSFKFSTPWQGNIKLSNKIPKPSPLSGKIFFVDVPGAAQSFINFFSTGPSRQDAEYFNTLMVSKIYGGGFTSRINMNLREDKGYSYGAYGSFKYLSDFSVLKVGTQVRANSTYQSVMELYNELQMLYGGEKPATQEELIQEQNGATLGLPAKFATSNSTLNMYWGLIKHGLPLDYYNEYQQKIRAVELNSLAKSAEAFLNPKSVKILVVGDSKAPVIHRVNDKDVPFTKNGATLTLERSLMDLMKSGKIQGKELVILDADGNLKRRQTI